MKILLNKILNFIHIIILIFYFIPLFTNNKKVLKLYIIINIVILLKWILFNGCWLTKLQNLLENRKDLWLPRILKKLVPFSYHKLLKRFLPFLHDFILLGILLLAFYKLDILKYGLLVILIIFIGNYIKHGNILFKW